LHLLKFKLSCVRSLNKNGLQKKAGMNYSANLSQLLIQQAQQSPNGQYCGSMYPISLRKEKWVL